MTNISTQSLTGQAGGGGEQLATTSQRQVSPTVMRWVESGKSYPKTVCVACPAALWMRDGGDLACYCRPLMNHIWPGTNLDDCDGPEILAAANGKGH